MRTVVVSLIAEDRPGLVAELARTVAEQGGNWLESQMGRLGGTFAGAVLVELEDDRIEGLSAAVRDLPDVDVVEVTAATTATAADEEMDEVRLQVIGQDQPGIVRDVTAALAAHGLGIHDLYTSISDAPMSGERLFEAIAVVGVATDIDLAGLRTTLDEVSTQLSLDIQVDDGEETSAWGEVPERG
ncbi:glycine cleavage system protein R [Janibacter limosus]|jgi:glycine cleavage system regulatory protein|uniref:glycine cleavage system protein R n=1 Tax=Janibacter limosus TaxID=53458 RepID=UPI000A055ABA|nr:ACT domain-containing protein [Janibacter limosus]